MQASCAQCQKPFSRPSSQLRRSKNHFCSRSCAATFNNKAAPKRSVEGACGVCQKPIPSSKLYCSDVCRKIARRSRRIGNPSLPYAQQSDDYKARRKAAVVSWRRRTKRRAVVYKGGSCVCCGYDACQESLVFHHPDPDQKDFSISGLSISWERIKVEIDKCVLVCANCHGEIHAGVRTLG